MDIVLNVSFDQIMFQIGCYSGILTVLQLKTVFLFTSIYISELQIWNGLGSYDFLIVPADCCRNLKGQIEGRHLDLHIVSMLSTSY